MTLVGEGRRAGQRSAGRGLLPSQILQILGKTSLPPALPSVFSFLTAE